MPHSRAEANKGFGASMCGPLSRGAKTKLREPEATNNRS